MTANYKDDEFEDLIYRKKIVAYGLTECGYIRPLEFDADKGLLIAGGTNDFIQFELLEQNELHNRYYEDVRLETARKALKEKAKMETHQTTKEGAKTHGA